MLNKLFSIYSILDTGISIEENIYGIYMGERIIKLPNKL